MSATQGQPIVCKAMVAREINKPMVIESVTVAPPQEHEVRIQVLYSSCCHTDYMVLHQPGDPETPLGADQPGVILGHEAYGVVESVGEGVTRVQPGDYVIPAYIPQCNESDCRFCMSPKTNLCSKIRVTQGKGVMPNGTSRFTDSNGKPLRHFMGISAFSQYTVCADISVVKLDERSVPFADKLPPMGCGLLSGYGAVVKAQLEQGETCVVIGMGAVGLSAVLAAKKLGASKIIGVDINDNKKEIAEKLGVTHFINPKANPEKTIQQQVIELTDGWGCDVSVECVGNVNLMRSALEMTVKGTGRAMIVGVAVGAEIASKSFYLVSGRTWSGCAYGNVKPFTQLPGYVDQVISGEYPINDFITGQRPFEEINEAFDDMHVGQGIRTVINMTQPQ